MQTRDVSFGGGQEMLGGATHATVGLPRFKRDEAEVVYWPFPHQRDSVLKVAISR